LPEILSASWFPCRKHHDLGGEVPRRVISVRRRAVGVGECVASPEGPFAEWPDTRLRILESANGSGLRFRALLSGACAPRLVVARVRFYSTTKSGSTDSQSDLLPDINKPPLVLTNTALRKRPRCDAGGPRAGRPGFRSRRSAGHRTLVFACKGSVRLRSGGYFVCGG
jgi:hypothetical protein